MSKGYRDYFLAFSKSSAKANGRSFFQAAVDTPLVDHVFSSMSHRQRVAAFQALLEQKLHGISFSPYLRDQAPGTLISEAQIHQRLSIIRPYVDWVRTFSCMEGNDLTPQIAHSLGLKTMVGVGIGDDFAVNEDELQHGIAIASNGHADILAVGNEVLLRGDVSEDELLEYIQRAKQSCPDVPIGYVDAYFLFEDYPRVADACDVLLINCYPFWESTPAEYALAHIKDMYRRAVAVAQGKPVIISETGWPSMGTACGQAIPSFDYALSYFVSVCQWAQQEKIPLFYFSSFDEAWKTKDEGDVGASWGVWDADGALKYG